MILRRPSALPLVAVLLVAGCTPSSSSQPGGALPTFSRASSTSVSGAHPNPIRHIIVIVQENRTVDNLFNGFPGADTSRIGKNSQGQDVQLHAVSLTAPYDLSHKHRAWLHDDDGGAMNGFDLEGVNCYAVSRKRCPNHATAAYGFVPENQVRPYWAMAKRYTFADELFQTNQGPSFPAHQYIVSGTSTINGDATIRASENPTNPRHVSHQGGCDSQPHTTVETIKDDGSAGPLAYPCFTRRSIMNLMDASGVTWNYYQAFGSSGEWHAVDALRPIWSRRQSYRERRLADAARAQEYRQRHARTSLVRHSRRRSLRPRRQKQRQRALLGCLDRERGRQKQVLEGHRDHRHLGRLGRLVRSRGPQRLQIRTSSGFACR